MNARRIAGRQAHLRQRTVILGLVAAAIAMLAGLNALTVHEASRLQTDSAKREIAAKAGLVAVAHERWLDESRTALTAAAAALRHVAEPLAWCSGFFADFVQRSESFDTLLMVSPSGDLLCSAQPVAAAINLSDRLYFQGAMATRQFAVGEFIVGRVSGKRVLPVALPVVDEAGAVEYVLVAGKQAEWLGRLVVAQAKGLDLQLSVIDVQGTVLARYPERAQGGAPRPDSAVGVEVIRRSAAGERVGVIEAPDLDGRPAFHAYAPLGDPPLLFAIVGRPRADALALVTDFRNYSFGQLLVAAALLFASIWWALGRLILRPLNRLAEGMRRVQAGELSWRSPEGPGTKEIAAIAQTLNSMLGKLEEANRQLQEMAATDALMGIANRRRFIEQMEREWRREGRVHKPLSLLMIDVDHFKLFNDSYGHQEGDRCLRRIAEAVKATCRRPGDLVARYGGEEIAVILPETDVDGACRLAEQVRTAVLAACIPHGRSALGLVSVSVGVGSADAAHAGGPDELVRRADAALYRAKAAGRNRVEVDGEPGPVA